MSRKNASPPPIDWSEAIDLYLLSLRAARRSDKTVRVYALALRHFREHLAALERAKLPGDVTLQDLREYQCGLLTGTASRRKKPQAAASVSRVTTTLAGFFRFLTTEERIARDPTLRLEWPRKSERPPGAVLSAREVERLLAASDPGTPKGVRDRALLELFYATGLRVSEAIALDLADLDHREREVTIRHGKGDKGRVVPVTRSAWEHLSVYLERARPRLASDHPDSARAVFLSTLGRRCCLTSIEKTVKIVARAAGLEKEVSPHVLRRTFATALLRNGVNVRVIQVLLGHRSLNTTARYLRLDAAELRRQLLLFHPRERFEP